MSLVDLAAWREQGFLHLRGWFPDQEVAAWQAECERLLASDLVDPDNGRTPFRFGASDCPERIDPVIDVSPLFAALAADQRVLAAAQALLGDEPRLFKDKLILKAPGVDGYQMHQDWAWGWQDLCPADQILSVSIQLDGAGPDNGGIELYPGAHHELLTPPGLATNFRPEEVARIDLDSGVVPDTQPGDVLLFHSLTPHRSGRNTSPRWRKSLYLTFNAARAGNLREAYYDGYRAQEGAFFR